MYVCMQVCVCTKIALQLCVHKWPTSICIWRRVHCLFWLVRCSGLKNPFPLLSFENPWCFHILKICLEIFSKVPLLLLFLILLLLLEEKTIDGLGRTAAALAITTLATSSVVCVEVTVWETNGFFVFLIDSRSWSWSWSPWGSESSSRFSPMEPISQGDRTFYSKKIRRQLFQESSFPRRITEDLGPLQGDIRGGTSVGRINSSKTFPIEK